MSIDGAWKCLLAIHADPAHAFPQEYAQQPVFYLHNKMASIQFILIEAIYAAAAVVYGCVILKRTGFTWHEGGGFQFHHSTMPPLHVLILAFFQVFVMLYVYAFVERAFLFENIWLYGVLSLLLSACLFTVYCAGKCIEYDEVTRRQLFFLDNKEYLCQLDHGDIDLCVVMPMEAVDSELEQRLQEGLDRVMDQQHIFRQSGLKIEEVARMIGTNRLYLSRHINEKYKMNFNEYLNHKRIEYAKEYMKNSRHEMQDRVACECGFISAQAFSRKFKEIEGVTPRVWLAELEKT